MALTRKSLKAMGLSDEQVDSIIEMHTETVDGLQDKHKAAEAKAADYDDVVKERDDLKAKSGDDFKKKYEDEHKAFADYKKDQEAKATAAVRDKAVEAYFEGKNITGENKKLAMRAAREEINSLVMDGEKIKDTASLDKLIENELKGLVVKTSKNGVPPITPPKSGDGKIMTREEIYKKDDKGRYVLDAAARQKALVDMAEAESNN